MKIKGIKYLIGLILTVFINLYIYVYPTQAMPFTQIPFEWEEFTTSTLTDYDMADDDHLGPISLGFSVTIGGATYDHFDMDSNGYVELLSGTQDPTEYGYGGIQELIDENPTSTYLLAAYDDLSSWEYGYYGYALQHNRAIFYYNTETYYDEGYELLNNFEIILNSNGKVQWNFNYADYDDYDFDLFSGLYFGNTGTLYELYREYIPDEESWIYAENNTNNVVPEPATIFLFSSSLIGFAIKLRKV